MSKSFGDLAIRPKLMILHNLFFLVLTCSVYFSLISLFEDTLNGARDREVHLLARLLQTDHTPLPPEIVRNYRISQGSPDALGMRAEVRAWLEAHPDRIWHEPAEPEVAWLLKRGGGFARLEMPLAHYSESLRRAKWMLFLVLGVVYALAVLLLELAIMPLYVYRPLRLMLRADEAVKNGHASHELIGEEFIPRDEIGQIMRSRNDTVAELRSREQELAEALARLEQTARDLQRKNELLEGARRTLAEQDRLASLGLLSASVAHELNTPLAVLRGSIEKLAETLPDSASRARLERMLRVTGRLQRISESLLDFVRPRRPEHRPVQVRDLIEAAWEFVAIDEKAAGVRFSNRVPEDACVTGDPDRLSQVFVNLLRNALNALPESGSIEVAADRQTGNGHPWLAIRVEDDGPGIPPDILPNIFDAFVSSRLDSRGTGLGLTVAEGIVRQHGGEIEASNRPGGGARILVRLPAGALEKIT